MSSQATEPDKCPIDHSARAKWLEHAQQANGLAPASIAPSSSSEGSSFISIFAPHDARARTRALQQVRQHVKDRPRPLGVDREVSSIPRTTIDPTQAADTAISNSASASHGKALNAEATSSRDVSSGNWIYPSEKMFFDAMRRKQHDPQAPDMAAIVPIHNAVNERAWQEILGWERRFAWTREANAKCGGPKLHSFSGDSKNLTPRARWNSLVGYTPPFDRHDWVVERCAGQPNVEYVIDFYAGKKSEKGHPLSFYLDVRPKLNSWEGWRMRVAKFVGL